MDLPIGDPPPGERLVDGGVLNVLDPRLPNDPPLPGRANPSPVPPSAKIAARPRIKDI